jgi:ubiquinol oxidase
MDAATNTTGSTATRLPAPAEPLAPVFSHRAPQVAGDRFAWGLAWCIDRSADLLFGARHAHRAVVLETMATIPGMIGALILHLRLTRRIDPQEGGVEALVQEARNERFHLLVFSAIARPLWWEWWLIRLGQAASVLIYGTMYLLSRRVAHRFVGYLEELAVNSYTHYLDDLQRNPGRNCLAPRAAIRYWHLPPDATLMDVVAAVRRDEVHHREHNHSLADCSGKRNSNWLPSPSPRL